ncbi:hypothetical protein MNBD_DELTA01-627 [hydrothermal vent metagenome]|uniref:Ice-binding protein C-terminal domain-containing protein n=1 Tax=hydrothermal vent metagenome TaxID=652676 RepID=A0A3B0RCV1_9ZZZZ
MDGEYVWGWDGLTTGGYNITNSEMGHLFYTELDNKGYYATDGTNPQPGQGFLNKGLFDNLVDNLYWSDTEYSADTTKAWLFNFNLGYQFSYAKTLTPYGLAVRDGDVPAIVPEPSTYLLLGSGIAGLILWKRKRKLTA